VKVERAVTTSRDSCSSDLARIIPEVEANPSFLAFPLAVEEWLNDQSTATSQE
jgi:hypothetical protein